MSDHRLHRSVHGFRSRLQSWVTLVLLLVAGAALLVVSGSWRSPQAAAKGLDAPVNMVQRATGAGHVITLTAGGDAAAEAAAGGEDGAAKVEEVVAGDGAEDALPQVSFARDILPILSDNCFLCHGADAGSREADLRLDLRESAVDEAFVIEPGDAAGSELIRRITSTSRFDVMPPPATHKTLTDEQIDLIRRWIDQGAVYEPHWAFVSPQLPPVPEVSDPDWASNAIDQFVMAKLDAEGLSPSPEADKRTLIRRVTFDLTGLPPTVEEVEAFVNDESPDAYEKVVDRLLASPHYGEHMARYWLDAVRYADTHGMHFDNYREIWPYRDWVIAAFNNNMPFDQFTIEQLAGDLLPEPTQKQLVATGFNRCNLTTNEGGSIVEEVIHRNTSDRVDAVGTVFLALTFNCAACHDHKYDPLSQKDYYRFYAFFNSLDGNPMDGNRRDHPPALRIVTDQMQEQIDQVKAYAAELEQQRDTWRTQKTEPAFQAWLAWQQQRLAIGELVAPDAQGIMDGLLVDLPLDRAGDQTTDTISDATHDDITGTIHGGAAWVDGPHQQAFRIGKERYIDLGDLADFSADQPFSYAVWLRTPGNVTGSAIARMDEKNQYRGWDLWIAQKQVSMHLIHHWPNNAIKVTTQAEALEPDRWHHVAMSYDGSGKASGVTIYVDGVAQPLRVDRDSLNGATQNEVTLRIGRRTPGAPLPGADVAHVRIYQRQLSEDQVRDLMPLHGLLNLLALDAEQRTEQQTAQLREHYLREHSQPYIKLTQAIAQRQKQAESLRENGPVTLIYREMAQPRPTHLLTRGEYDQPAEEVERNTPTFLPPFPEDQPRDRLGLAHWLLDPEHPLTARVTVNRYWQQFFGYGLVKTSEDFGVQGQWPSHPELLDWLAVRFVEDGWDVKQFVKRMVMSSTYRQSARVTPELYQRDPENRLLARGPRYRMDAEMLRDQALAVSDQLVPTLGGPPVKIPQPAGLWEAVAYPTSDTARFVADTGDKIYRRSVYTFWKRTAPPPQLAIFDAPNRESCVVRRERTNSPMQALVLLNEVQYVEAARRLAELALHEELTDVDDRLHWMFRRVTLREPTQTELDILQTTYREQRELYAADVDAAKAFIATGATEPDAQLAPDELAAWSVVASMILNLDEVVNK